MERKIIRREPGGYIRVSENLKPMTLMRVELHVRRSSEYFVSDHSRPYAFTMRSGEGSVICLANFMTDFDKKSE